jgi:hypothetical protein
LLDKGQIVVGGDHGDVPHVGRQEGKLGLYVVVVSVPSHKGVHRKGMAQVMKAGWSPLRSEDGQGSADADPVLAERMSGIARPVRGLITADVTPDEELTQP